MDAPSSHAGRRADDASVSMRRAAAPVAAAAREVRRRLEQTGAVSSSSSGGDARRAVDRAAQSAAVIGTLRGLVQRRFGQRVDLQQIAGQSCPVLHRARGSIAELSPESTEPLRAAECVSAVDRIA